MKLFNLAETRIAERTYCRDQIGRRLRFIMLLGVMTVTIAAVCYGCRLSVGGKASRVQSELTKVQGRCSKMRQEIAGVRTKTNQRKWQETLAEGSDRWIGVMEAVLGRVPQDLWLNRLESSASTSSVIVEGQTRSFESLSGFTGALRSYPKFSEVVIRDTRVVSGRVTVVEFALSIKLKNAAPAPADAQPATDPQAVPLVQESS